GRNLDQLVKEAGVSGLSPLITQADGALPMEGRSATMTARLLAVHADTIGAMEAYADKYGDRLCPMMGRIFSASLADTMQKQREIRSPYHGYLTAAQVLMRFHGCFSGEID